MTANYGLTTIAYGINFSLTGYVLESVSIDGTAENRTELFDDDGNLVYSDSDDYTETVTIGALVKTGTAIPTPGDVISLLSINWEVISTRRIWSSRDAVKLDLTIRRSQYLSLS